jgi:predicted transcriptional regulator
MYGVTKPVHDGQPAKYLFNIQNQPTQAESARKRRRSLGIEVYLSPDLTRQVAELAAKRVMTQSALCRELIASAMSDQTEMQGRIERIERLCAAAVLSPAIATGVGEPGSPQNVERARQIITGALAGAPNVVKRLVPASDPAPGVQPAITPARV